MGYVISEINNKVIGIDVSKPTHTGDLNETIMTAIHIPANTFIEGDFMQIKTLYRKDTTNGFKPRAYINSSPDLSGTPVLLWTQNTAARQFYYNREYFIDSNASMITFYYNTNISQGYPTEQSNASLISGEFSVDWTIDQYLVITIELNVITDTGEVPSVLIERKRP